jgi:hypothetical protein
MDSIEMEYSRSSFAYGAEIKVRRLKARREYGVQGFQNRRKQHLFMIASDLESV